MALERQFTAAKQLFHIWLERFFVIQCFNRYPINQMKPTKIAARGRKLVAGVAAVFVVVIGAFPRTTANHSHERKKPPRSVCF